MKQKQISRRAFLKGTAAGALGMAAAGLFGGCAKDNSETAVPEPTDAPQNIAIDWLGSAPVIDDSQVVATYDCDVVVIGAGTAGLFAACAAAEEGANTILVEKFGEEYGGSGIRDTLAAVNSRQQIENNDNPDPFDVMTEMYRQSNGYGDQRLFKVWAEHSGEAIDWYGDLLEKNGLRLRHEGDDHSKTVSYPIYDVGH